MRRHRCLRKARRPTTHIETGEHTERVEHMALDRLIDAIKRTHNPLSLIHIYKSRHRLCIPFPLPFQRLFTVQSSQGAVVFTMYKQLAQVFRCGHAYHSFFSDKCEQEALPPGIYPVLHEGIRIYFSSLLYHLSPSAQSANLPYAWTNVAFSDIVAVTKRERVRENERL